MTEPNAKQSGSSSEPGTPPRATDGRAGSCSRWIRRAAPGRWLFLPEYCEFGGSHFVSPARLIWWLSWLWTKDDGRIKYALHLRGPLGVLRGLLRWRRSRWWIEWQWTDWIWCPEYFESARLPGLSRLSSYKPHFWARWLGWSLYCTARDGRDWTKETAHLTGPLGVIRGLLRWRRR